MALIRSADAKALFMAAVLVMAMVLSPYPAQGDKDNCIDLRGMPCNEETCVMACKSWGYVDPVVRCEPNDLCCCFVKLPPASSQSQLAPAAVEDVE
ncbi:hypothetical protein HU200_051230 [Digitaria exilis]|uniref:Uncharacterized protein n=1 Tax=Digitaria exilis TaxID=1010633 RepID=A0A835AW06_9POAL|nr:hypothetical protein HU200_051230 [Digitaria exilis]